MSQTPPLPPPPSQPPAAPPPPPAGSPPGGTSNAPFSIGDAVGYGWNAYWKNLGPMLLIALVIFAVGPAFNLVGLIIGNQVVSTFIQLLAQIVGIFLTLGLVRATLAVTRGEEPRVSMLFETDRFGTYLVASILFLIGAFLILTLTASLIFSIQIGPRILSAVAFVITASVAMTAIFVFYSFFGWVIVDQDESGPIKALKRSAGLVSGHFWPLLGLGAVLFLISVPGLALSGIVLFLTLGMTDSASVIAYRALSGIGLFFTYGLTFIVWAYAYRALSGQSVTPVQAETKIAAPQDDSPRLRRHPRDRSVAPVAPPPSAASPPGGASNTPFRIRGALNYGWKAYWKNLGPMLLIILAIVAVNVIFGVIGLPFNQDTQFFVATISWIVSVLLALGLVRATLAVTRGEKPKVSMLLEAENFGPYLVASIMFGIGAAIAFRATAILGIIFIMFSGFYGFVIVDQNETRPIKALKRSVRLVSGRFWSMLGLAIVLTLINIVGLLLCLVGVLFTLGITAIAWAYAYRMLSGQSVAKLGCDRRGRRRRGRGHRAVGRR